MESDHPVVHVSQKTLRTGRVLSALPVLLLLFSGGMKLSGSAEVAKGFEHLGWPARLAVPLGIVEIVITILYIIPQTTVLGAILVTGYLGGAIATHVRLGESFYLQALFGVLVWLGLYLRDPRLRGLIPLRN